jgi:hypothetical protein
MPLNVAQDLLGSRLNHLYFRKVVQDTVATLRRKEHRLLPPNSKSLSLTESLNDHACIEYQDIWYYSHPTQVFSTQN